MKKKILVCEFHQESNTFNPIVNGITRFNDGDAFEGEAVFQKSVRQKRMVCGFVDAIERHGGEVIPGIIMHSGSGGRVSDEAMEHFCRRFREIAEEAEFDAICLALHGATCTQSCDDACGEILAIARELAGVKPVAAACDLHAKITEKMLNNADILCGYQTYPHVDIYQTGDRAGELCMRMLNGEKFYCAASYIPVLVPPAGYTAAAGAFKELMDQAKALICQGTLADASIFVVQPWLDVDPIASCVLTVGCDEQVVLRNAKELAEGLYAIREKMWPDLTDVDAVIDFAEKNTSGKPVILADSADSPNGGAVGDGPIVALRLLERGSQLRSAMFLRDAEAVDQAFRIGEGATAEFSFGGKLTPGMPGPATATAKVVMLCENGVETGPYPAMGRTAVIAAGNMKVVLCENGSSSADPGMYRSFGIEPTEYDLLVVKANTSFRAFYAPVTDLIFVGDTPGAGASNLLRLDWKRVPKDMYPFAELGRWAAESFLW